MAKRNEKFLEGIQVKVAGLLIQDGAQKCFRGHVEAFYRMVVAYNKEIDKWRRKAEEDKGYQKELEKYNKKKTQWPKNGEHTPPPTPPKPKWAKENWVFGHYSPFCKINDDRSSTIISTGKLTPIFVPPANKRKTCPIEWISNSHSNSCIPTPDQEGMCKYVLLSIIHDEIKWLKGETQSSEFIYFNQRNQLKSDWFDFGKWGTIFYQESLSNHDDYNSKIELALQYVKKYLAKVPISRLIEQGESYTLEFKETLDYDTQNKGKNKDILLSSLKTIAGFLNAASGTLLIGVDDSGKIKGIRRDLSIMKDGNNDKFQLKIQNYLKDRFQPQPIGKVNISFEKFRAETICRVDVQASKDIIHLDNKVYVREGNTTQLLEGRTLIEWVQENKRKQ